MVSLKTAVLIALGVLTVGLVVRPSSAQNSNSFPVVVFVFDSVTLSGISGANVDLGGVTTTTDSSGNATFQNWTRLGSIPVSVSATGYNSNSGTLNIAANTKIPFQIPLQAIQTGPPTIDYYYVNDIGSGGECGSGGQFSTEDGAIAYAKTIPIGGTDPCGYNNVEVVTVFAAMSDGTAKAVWSTNS